MNSAAEGVLPALATDDDLKQYRATLIAAGYARATVSARLNAARRFYTMAQARGYRHDNPAQGVKAPKDKTDQAERVKWLPLTAIQRVLTSPDPSTVRGKRDRAILAVLLGGGLRRSEAARLTVDHVQQREGRWVLVDIVGKRNKTRTVPIPSWAKVAIDAWTEAAGIREGRLFRSVHKGGYLNGESMAPQAIYSLVREHAGGLGVAAHDLRRTFAKLAHKGGAGLDQIQLTLGHASIQTTERYLGLAQDLTDAPCDRLGLRLAS